MEAGAPPQAPEGFAVHGDPSPPAYPGAPSAHPNEVPLGGVVVPVYPQRIAYLENRLGRTVREFAESGQGLEMDSFVNWLGERAYLVLSALIPSLPSRLSEHQFRGYASKEAYDAGDYNPEADSSPTFPELVGAFEMAFKVNRFDVLGNLRSLVDPTLLQKALSAEMATALSKRHSGSSASSASPSAGSPE